MEGWIVAAIVAVISAVYFLHQKKANATNHAQVTQPAARPAVRPVARQVPLAQRSETGSMVYFANDRHGRQDREYQFNYKKVDGAWRAYILKMPDLGRRDPGSIPTHRLWDNGRPYICWNSRVTSLKDMQNISRVWADSVQEYIATGKRFGAEQDL